MVENSALELSKYQYYAVPIYGIEIVPSDDYKDFLFGDVTLMAAADLRQLRRELFSSVGGDDTDELFEKTYIVVKLNPELDHDPKEFDLYDYPYCRVRALCGVFNSLFFSLLGFHNGIASNYNFSVFEELEHHWFGQGPKRKVQWQHHQRGFLRVSNPPTPLTRREIVLLFDIAPIRDLAALVRKSAADHTDQELQHFIKALVLWEESLHQLTVQSRFLLLYSSIEILLGGLKSPAGSNQSRRISLLQDRLEVLLSDTYRNRFLAERNYGSSALVQLRNSLVHDGISPSSTDYHALVGLSLQVIFGVSCLVKVTGSYAAALSRIDELARRRKKQLKTEPESPESESIWCEQDYLINTLAIDALKFYGIDRLDRRLLDKSDETALQFAKAVYWLSRVGCFEVDRAYKLCKLCLPLVPELLPNYAEFCKSFLEHKAEAEQSYLSWCRVYNYDPDTCKKELKL